MKKRYLSQKWVFRYLLVIFLPGLALGAALAFVFSGPANALAQIPDAAAAVQSLRTTVTIALALVGAAALLTTGLVLWLARSYASSLWRLHAKTARLAEGEVWERAGQPAAASANDPLGALDQAIEQLNGQLHDLDRTARLLVAGDPCAARRQPEAATPLARRFLDVAERQRALQETVGSCVERWADSVGQIGETAAGAGETAQSLEHLTRTLVGGLNHQAGVIERCDDAVQQSDRSMREAGQALEAQQRATEEAKARAEQIGSALAGVVDSVEGVQRASSDAAQITQSGTERVLQTIKGIDRIRQQVDQLGGKMSALGQGSDEIGSIVGTIEEIASQTNLLAINATIEAAHAESQAHQLTETLLNRFMIGQARLVRKLIESGMEGQPPSYWADIAGQANIDSIYATDEDGVTIISNDPAGIGFRFPEDPNAQASVFRQLLKQKDGEICQDPQRRSLDNQIFKYVGVSRRDRPGIVQVGFNTSSLAKFELQIGGFTVVAGEVYQLADRARSATGEIRNLIKNMQKIIAEAVSAMRSSTGEVDGLSRSANEAGHVLEEIHESFDQVLQLAGQATAEIGAMRQIIDQFSAATGEILSTTRQQAVAGKAVQEYLQSALAGLRELAQSGDQYLETGGEALRVLDALRSQIEGLSGQVNQAVLATDRFCVELGSHPTGALGEPNDNHTTVQSYEENRLDVPALKPLPLPES